MRESERGRRKRERKEGKTTLPMLQKILNPSFSFSHNLRLAKRRRIWQNMDFRCVFAVYVDVDVALAMSENTHIRTRRETQEERGDRKRERASESEQRGEEKEGG